MINSDIAQIGILAFSLPAAWIVSRPETWRRWAFILGFLGQPFWFITVTANGQWGILILCIWYTYCWGQGIWFYWVKTWLLGHTFAAVGPRIVCAACMFPSGRIIPSIRHFDDFMFDALRGTYPKEGQAVQGFVDQFGKFYTREEAWNLAKKNRQILRRVGGDGKRLYSENLY
jgi:hypothetical protein